jgi:SAM-dependent methyltransferase
VSFFTAAADNYDRFMGRYSVQLGPQMSELAGVERGQRVLDVGCGPGALTAQLVARGAAVSAVDPSPQFVAAARERNPGADVREANAEELPFEDDEFDATLAQLVVHFMADPLTGLREMARVTRTGGVVAACVWDNAGGHTPLGPFWRAVMKVDPTGEDESLLPGTREGHLGELFREAGIRDVQESAMPVRIEHATFDEWWQPFTGGVGPAGVYLKEHPEREDDIRELCRAELGEPFVLETRAWAARGVAHRPQEQ